MSSSHILGFPRIGAQRELKRALESYWHGQSNDAELAEVARTLRQRHWQLQADRGLDFVTVGDFAWYDHVLQTLAHLGGLPARFGFAPSDVSLRDYFVCARGDTDHFAMEMTKWFDTNYHYLVPEYSPGMRFEGGVRWLIDELREAQSIKAARKVVLVGPITLLYLGKEKNLAGNGSFTRLALLPALLDAYTRLLNDLARAGATWIQIDEPILSLDLPPQWRQAFAPAYEQLCASPLQVLLTTYFGDVSEHLQWLRGLPVAGIHIDVVRGPEQLKSFVATWPTDKVLSVGIVDGRNIWKADLNAALNQLTEAEQIFKERLWLASSCSLLHVPVDLEHETKLDPEIRSWLAFATQKIEELVTLRRSLDGEVDQALSGALQSNANDVSSRKTSPRVHNALTQQRLRSLEDRHAKRASPFGQRIAAQQSTLQLPLFPTTTIGSFPQTPSIRQTRAAYKAGKVSHLDYLEAMREQIRLAVAKQEEYGLDVLVHGEAERNDMVEYFGEQLWGYAFTENGWVQSYGSRCVKPPLIYGDVYRPEPMTVNWARYAQSLTQKPMKGMLTGPVTMLQWSFVRDDQPRQTTALQIALALRDEVCDLEAAGIRIIQIDEPAFREGLPLKRCQWQAYLDWAVRAFRVCASGVGDGTQIHTHMCYSEFNDILPAIAALDADVITIETSRSDMDLLDAFAAFAYPNDIGPGVYDIHSPRTPRVEEMVRLMKKALDVLPAQRLWVNPDCGLKTRSWAEVDTALHNMVRAATQLRLAATAQKENTAELA